MSKGLLCAVVLVFLPSSLFAEPITLQLEGTVNYIGFPSGTNLLATLDDPFTALVTYESDTPLSGYGPADFYQNAVIGIEVVVHSVGGDLLYVAEGQESATTVNFASVHSEDLFFQVTDYDENGELGSVRGPSVTAATQVVYAPNNLALEIGGSFATALLADSLPTSPFTDVAYTRLSIGFWGRLSPNLLHQVVIDGSGNFAQPVAVPEPSMLVLFGTGLAGLVAKRKARHPSRKSSLSSEHPFTLGRPVKPTPHSTDGSKGRSRSRNSRSIALISWRERLI